MDIINGTGIALKFSHHCNDDKPGFVTFIHFIHLEVMKCRRQNINWQRAGRAS